MDSSSPEVDSYRPDGDTVTENEMFTLIKTYTERSIYQGEFGVDPEGFDFVKLLKTIRHHTQKEGIATREVGLCFEDYSVFGKDQSHSYLQTMSSVLKGPYGAIRAAKEAKNVPDRAILDRVSGVVSPGEMLLVLGRPGSGCSTFLRNMSGTELHMYTGSEGEISYGNVPQKEMVARFAPVLVYNPELDVHYPHLTVKQTLDFALSCKTPQRLINGRTPKEHVRFNRDMLATLFGLRHAFHTKVGNDYIRGVSGGERKRVSIAEAMACDGSVYCWDNATRGLDASTALEYARAIRVSTDLMRKTSLVTLYQAGENVYETFDKVTVLYSGKQVYFGSTKDAKRYFEEMGFECPQRQTTPEFLTAVTDPAGRFAFKGMEDRVPRTADEFQQYWFKSPEYKALQQEIANYKQSCSRDETESQLVASFKQDKHRYSRDGSKFTLNFYQQLMLCVKRAFQNIWGDKAFTVIQVGAAVSQALIVGSLYYNTPDSVNGAFSRGGVIFFAVLYMSLMGLAEISNTFADRPILMKQRNYCLYHPSAIAVADVVVSIPVTVIINIFFSVIIYFLSNLQREAGKFFIFLLFTTLVALAMKTLFKATAAWNKSIAGANAFGGLFVLASLMYSSYMIQRPSMHPWFKWISYMNPVLYGFESLLTSEFHGRRMPCDAQSLTPNGPGYSSSGDSVVCAFVGSVKGQTWVSGDRYVELSYEYSYSHVWRNFGILILFILGFLAASAAGFEIIRPVTGGLDRLFFLRGKVPNDLVMPHEKADDEESARDLSTSARDLAPATLEKASSAEVLEELDDELRVTDIFVWKNVDYVIPYDGGKRKLLDAVSGYCLPGTLTALMGESGAGKTTLLNNLAQRIDMGVVTGDMLVNGKALDVTFVRRTGYVQQQDIHLPYATVREALRFAARLRRPASVPDAEKLDYVEKIIKVLDMEMYADAIIGTPGSGLNVEQRKKLTIGTELVAKPSLLLFLDEPTSGLDSQSSWAIVQLLRSLANAGQAILCTIHQPSATLFEEFDRLLLLKKGGQTVYFGDIGERSKDIVSYFESNGARTCSASENPAEYILEVIGAGATAHITQDWHEMWQKSSQKLVADQKIEELIVEGQRRADEPSGKDHSKDKELHSKYATSVFNEFKEVTLRTFTSFWRSPDYVMAKFFLMIINGLFIGFTFFGLKHSVTGMQNGMFCAFISMMVVAPLVNQLQAQCLLFREYYEGREKMSNTYRWWVMVFAQIVVEIPYTIVAATLMFICLYFPTQTDTSAPHMGIFYLTFAILLMIFIITFGFMLAYFAPNVESAAILVSFFFSFIVSFAGVVQPLNLMPGFWTFMYKVSPFTYVIQNLVGSFLYGREVVCSYDELSFLDPPSGQTCGEYLENFISQSGGYVTNPEGSVNCAYCPYSISDQYLGRIGIKTSYFGRNVGFMFVYAVFNIVACLALYKLFRLTSYKKKKA